MRWLVVGSLSFLLVLGFLAYRSPRVREIFEPPPAPRRAPAAAVPVEVSRPTPAAQPEPAARQTSRKPSPPPSETARPPAPQPKPTVPNSEVSTVLLGIFRARQVTGVALRVTDDVIEVAGEVESEQERQMTLDIVEKARETRRVDAEGLKVRRPER